MRVEAALSSALLSARTIRHLSVMLAAGALAILWLGWFTDIDLMLGDAVFDVPSRAFPWRDTWLTVTLNHVILKWLLILLAVCVVGYAGIDACRPYAGLSDIGRLQLRIVALSAILVPVVTSTLKHLSASHCPWDLLRYGGEQPYVRLFGTLPTGMAPGQCLPAGHASSALWLVALAVCWLPARPSRARAAALLAIGAGATVGYLQQLRGAHFMTHTLWSIWIACTIVVALIATLQGRPS